MKPSMLRIERLLTCGEAIDRMRLQSFRVNPCLFLAYSVLQVRFAAYVTELSEGT